MKECQKCGYKNAGEGIACARCGGSVYESAEEREARIDWEGHTVGHIGFIPENLQKGQVKG